MFCPSCGHAVVEDQKFCDECGKTLKGVTQTTAPLVIGSAAPESSVAASRVTESGTASAAADLAGGPVSDAARGLFEDAPEDPTGFPRLSELPTREITPRDEIPDPDWSTPSAEVPAVTLVPAADDWSIAPPESPELFDDLVTPTPAFPAPAVDPQEPPIDAAPATTQLPTYDGSGGFGAGGVGATGEIPELFDGSSDIYEYPVGRDPFRLKLSFILAFFGAIAVVMTAAADMIDVRTSVPVNGIATGITTIDDLGTNLAVAGFFGAAVMVVGGLLACFGFRWGAGLAGGAGLALVGWAGLVVGLNELRIASAESITRNTTDIAFTLKVTRDVGFWLVVAVAAIGLLVFVASLRSFGTGGRPAHNPWIAAIGAVAGVVLAAGPLLPEGNATFNNNFRSASQAFDLPTAYFGGRLGQLGLLGFTIVFGLLIVRAYGLGLAAGGVSVSLWLWISSLIEEGDFPLGIAAGNFGASDTIPHAVTSVGMVLTLLMLAVAAALATVGNARSPR